MGQYWLDPNKFSNQPKNQKVAMNFFWNFLLTDLFIALQQVCRTPVPTACSKTRMLDYLKERGTFLAYHTAYNTFFVVPVPFIFADSKMLIWWLHMMASF